MSECYESGILYDEFVDFVDEINNVDVLFKTIERLLMTLKIVKGKIVFNKTSPIVVVQSNLYIIRIIINTKSPRARWSINDN